MCAVQAGERLDCLDTSQPLVHVHRVQKRLIEPGLVFLRNEENLILWGRELLWEFLLPDA